MVYFVFFFPSFPLEETPTREGRGKGAASDFSAAKAGGTLFVLLFTYFSQSFLFSPGGSCAAAPHMLFIFSCEGLVTVQGVVYPVRLFIAQPMRWPELPSHQHFTSPNPGLRERAKGGEVTFGRWDEPASSGAWSNVSSGRGSDPGAPR